MTSTSTFSRSFRVPDAFRVGGGGSMAAIFFLFLDEKKLPKKPELLSVIESNDGLFDLGGRGFPVLGSTCVGFEAFWRSLIIVIA
jgi:hypothetical protein